MLANGFLPDVISSDVHTLSIDGPAFDLLTTMSKFLSSACRSRRVIRAATTRLPRHAPDRPRHLQAGLRG